MNHKIGVGETASVEEKTISPTWADGDGLRLNVNQKCVVEKFHSTPRFMTAKGIEVCRNELATMSASQKADLSFPRDMPNKVYANEGYSEESGLVLRATNRAEAQYIHNVVTQAGFNALIGGVVDLTVTTDPTYDNIYDSSGTPTALTTTTYKAITAPDVMSLGKGGGAPPIPTTQNVNNMGSAAGVSKAFATGYPQLSDAGSTTLDANHYDKITWKSTWDSTTDWSSSDHTDIDNVALHNLAGSNMAISVIAITSVNVLQGDTLDVTITWTIS